MLSKDFVVLIGISIVISIPITYFMLNNWLEGFQYRAALAWWIFATAGSSALVIALLAASYQSIKIAFINPVKSLRSD